MRIIRAIIIVVMSFYMVNLYGQEQNDSVKIKIKRKYSNGKLKEEFYYDQQGRLIRRAIPNYYFYRGEAVNGQVYTLSYEYDTVAYVYEYSELAPQKRIYRYNVKDSIKSELELYEEYFYKNELLKKVKYYFESKSDSKYFRYNKYGDLRREKDKWFITWINYDYSKDSLIQKRTKRGIFAIELFNKCEYEYNSQKQIKKYYYYNYDNRLTEIYEYSYDEKSNLTMIEETWLDIYKVPHQRKDRKSYIYYKYNEYGYLMEEQKVSEVKGDNYIYNYEYVYY